MSKCACIVLNYNDSVTTVKLLKRIYSFSVFSLILVVDNCSTDDSFDVLSQYADKKVKVVRSPRNGGYGFGNNFGMDYCYKLGYQYAVVTNPDVNFREETVQKLLEKIELCTTAAMIAPKQLDINKKQISMIAWKIPSVLEACIYPWASHKILYDKEYIEQNDCVEVDCVPGAFFLVNLEKMKEIGGYDENIFMYCEESLIGIKIRNAGFKTVLLSSDYYIHEHPHDREKEIKNEVRLHKVWNSNRLYILKNYLHASPFMCQFAKVVYTVDFGKIKAKNCIKKVLLRFNMLK